MVMLIDVLNKGMGYCLLESEMKKVLQRDFLIFSCTDRLTDSEK